MHDDALKELWQTQSVPSRTLPGEKEIAVMRSKMKSFDRAIRWRDIAEVVAGLLLAGYYAWEFFRVPFLLSKIGCAVVVASCLFIDWWMIRGKIKLPKSQPNAPLYKAIAIELRKVETQIGLHRSIVWWYLLPLFIGFTLHEWGMPSPRADKIAFVFVMLVVGAVVYWWNQRRVRKNLLPLKQNLESLLNFDEAIPQPPVKKKSIMSKIMMACAALVLFSGAYWLHAKNSDETELDIQKIVDESVREKSYHGLVVGVVDAEGSKIYSAGRTIGGSDFKSAQPGLGREVNGDTVFAIASITKVFTSVLLQDMVDRGELELDHPVEKFLPSSVKVPSKNGKKITLRHLATHHSGLPRLPDNFKPKDKANPYADYTVERLYEFLSSHKLSREPGEKYDYSNLGVDLLGLALSIKGGADLETLFAKRIFEPLKMNDTHIRVPAQHTNIATGHSLFGKPVKHWDWHAPFGGAGALRSSANDLLKFLEANLELAETPLSHALKQTHVRQEKGGVLTPDMALGWHIGMEYKEKKFKWYNWHNGGTYGFHSYIAFDKEGRRGVVVLGNSANDAVDAIGQRVIKSKIFENKPPQLFPIAQLNPKIYDAYAGRYVFDEKSSLTVTREGNRLKARITGQSPIEVFPKTETEFFYKVVNAQLTFETNKSGSVASVILHQNGRDRRLMRSAE